MNTQHQNKNESEVYSISGFRDTLASPVFYPVIVVTLVLGVTSIFGFVQNPLKLKSVVNVIQQKVGTREIVNDSFNLSQAYIDNMSSKNIKELTINTKRNFASTETNYAFDLFSDNETSFNEKTPVDGNFERIAFNYDVTSESFWTDLDSSRLETASEEIERKEQEAETFGAPLRIEYRENSPADFNVEDESIYSINTHNRS